MGILEAKDIIILHHLFLGPKPIQGVVKDIDYTIDDINPRVAAHAQFRDVPLIKGKIIKTLFSTVYIYIDVGQIFLYLSQAAHLKQFFDYIRERIVMNWWSILKNQVASTKGKKTFQLDFNQPMIEEEDNCKNA